jgi:hypothetical protein
MNAVYTYRMQQGAVQTEVCESLWDALSRARYDLEQQEGAIVPVSITVGLCIFHYGHLLLLLGYDGEDRAREVGLGESDVSFARQ